FVQAGAVFFLFASRRRHTSSKRDWSSDVCSSAVGDRAVRDGRRRSAALGVRGLRTAFDHPELLDHQLAAIAGAAADTGAEVSVIERKSVVEGGVRGPGDQQGTVAIDGALGIEPHG